MRILLAEDEKALSNAIMKIFEKNRYAADAVYNGEDALAYLESGDYDAAVLDIMMPKLDGITVLKRVRAAGNRIPILMLTAKSEIEDRVLGLDSGADDYLPKPFDTRELLARIRAITRAKTETDAILDMLSQPNAPFFEGKTPREKPERPMEDFIPHGMSPEVPYESRFFTVTVTADGEIAEPDFSRIISVDNDSAEAYIAQASRSRKDRGFIGQFRYLKTADERMTRILFLDCGRRLDAFRSFLWTSILVGLLGCLTVFLVFLFTAGKLVKPIAESYEKQKRFISDAGHEIKTPLTIIRANTDVLLCDGEKEELAEIQAQTKRLTELTNNLVYLSRMEEAEQPAVRMEYPLSDIVGETAAAFRAPAAARKLTLAEQIAPDLRAVGSPDDVRRLVSILLENAMKYAPAGGSVRISLTDGKKAIRLSVFNETEARIDEAELRRVFDRFYRMDASRNSATGGHGIGLSIAKAIAEAQGGSISAGTETGRDFRITVLLPPA